MRTVIKSVFRSFSAVTNATQLDSMTTPPISLSPLDTATQQWLRRDNCSAVCSSSKPLRIVERQADIKTESLSPVYKLTVSEQTCFEELQDRECDYYPNIASKGDTSVLNMDLKNYISEQNVNSNNIIFSLKNIRFVNSIVFNQDFDVFLTTVNYLQRLLHIKAVKKDLMPFITAAMYDLAFEHKVGKPLAKDQVALFLSLTGIPLNHIEDFSRMKSLLLKQFNCDLGFITITDYLQVLLKVNLDNNREHLSDSHNQLVDIACVLATSCELSHFSLACQAISLINISARHVSFERSFSHRYVDIIEKFPMIFVSPVRLHQFSKLDKVLEEDIEHCAECMVRFLSKYYERSRPRLTSEKRQSSSIRKNIQPQLWTVIEAEEEEDEKEDNLLKSEDNKLDIDELIEKLNKVSLAIKSQAVNGKQKQRQKRIKKKLSRQLKKIDRSRMERACFKALVVVEDEDSAISSSSNLTSPANSPCVVIY